MDEILKALEPLIYAYSGDFGVVTQVVTIMGSLRLVNKPLFATLRAVVELTYWTDSDNIFLDNVETSKFYTSIIFVLDWVASIKLKK